MEPLDGGPAFPVQESRGMSLLDWFAGQALAGLLANGWCAEQRDGNESMRDLGHETLSVDAYAIADAMLKTGRGE